jgi:hypothetical protein
MVTRHAPVFSSEDMLQYLVNCSCSLSILLQLVARRTDCSVAFLTSPVDGYSSPATKIGDSQWRYWDHLDILATGTRRPGIRTFHERSPIDVSGFSKPFVIARDAARQNASGKD